jgi:hypothetical protein
LLATTEENNQTSEESASELIFKPGTSRGILTSQYFVLFLHLSMPVLDSTLNRPQPLSSTSFSVAHSPFTLAYGVKNPSIHPFEAIITFTIKKALLNKLRNIHYHLPL